MQWGQQFKMHISILNRTVSPVVTDACEINALYSIRDTGVRAHEPIRSALWGARGQLVLRGGGRVAVSVT